MPDATDAIISIHPDYANAILSGTKTIELRRRVPELPPGTRLWIYATRPIRAVLGFTTVQDTARAHPTIIWKDHGPCTGLDHTSFKAYFNGSQVAVAVLLTQAQRVRPIPLEQLREIRHGFHPPQVVTRLSMLEAKALRKLADQ